MTQINLFWRLVGVVCLLMYLAVCSPKHLIAQGIANELATQSSAPEDDLVLAREASAVYLKSRAWHWDGNLMVSA